MSIIISSVAWPITIIFVVLLFRKDLKVLLGRLISIGVKDAGMVFQTQKFEDRPPEAAKALDFQNQSNEKHSYEEALLQGFDKDYIANLAKEFNEWLDRQSIFDDERLDVLSKSLAVERVKSYAFLVNQSIYGSQVAFLELILNQPQGVARVEGYKFYQAGMNSAPGLYVNYSYDQWLLFLINWGVIVEKDGVVVLTGMGRAYLRHVQNNPILRGKGG